MVAFARVARAVAEVALPAERNADADVGKRLAAYLADMVGAWRAATPEERDKVARQRFSNVVGTNRTAAAVAPRPDPRPFFSPVAVVPGASSIWRKRRGSVRR
ncbi:MAG: hypothetical protein M3Q10_11990 [Chloroflexota bacterium]|nr:hypothetical protein [Chloroflexota bacterium]